MFKNPSLNNVFSKHFDGFYIYSNVSEIEIILRELANNLSKKYLILYISNTDTFNLNPNIYHVNIFNEKALKYINKLSKLDFVFVENISFLNDFSFPKGVKIIACGFLKSDLRYFLKIKTRILRFVYTKDYFKIYNKKCDFTYNFKPKKQSIFQENKIDFDIKEELEFYLHCLEQGFRFYDFRNTRKQEFLNAFSNGNVLLNNEPFIKDISKEYFYMNDKKINCDFIPNNTNNLNYKIIKTNAKNQGILTKLKQLLNSNSYFKFFFK
ncbi:hypothetical protein AVANS_1783 [Campylobacter sp. RM5004]|uniref:hypothetical protein n=1 Tax=Campylobacter sp. RM5004 TaxID=1660078 RepID=UPI001EFC23C6|nr:hypothetical protein [Campylobacter sp. RM5004]ULO02385.1 hypothetical protein AVANS_1783 [Campylobacter sp. RM5004]